MSLVTSLSTAPEGSPQWLVVAFGVGALLIGLFGRGFAASTLAWIRNLRAEQTARLATKETAARQQEREYRAIERNAAAEEMREAFDRLGNQAREQDRRITELVQEVDQLRQAQRHQYHREQQIMDGLVHHAAWDFLARQQLPADFPEPSPLLPAREQLHSAEWGTSEG